MVTVLRCFFLKPHSFTRGNIFPLVCILCKTVVLKVGYNLLTVLADSFPQHQ